jgi:hypothetical protein
MLRYFNEEIRDLFIKRGESLIKKDKAKQIEKKIKVTTIKLGKETRHFNNNQTVFVIQMTGDQTALCRGKYRGKYKWCNAWVKWDNNPNLHKIKEIEIAESDYNNIFNEPKINKRYEKRI